MPTIIAQIKSQIDPFEIHQAMITSDELQWTWTVDENSFETIYGTFKAISLFPGRINVALSDRLKLDDAPLTHKSISSLNFLKHLIEKHFSKQKPLKTDIHITERTELRSYIFRTNVAPIFEMDATTTKLNLKACINLLRMSLEEMTHTLKRHDLETFSKQVVATHKIADQFNAYATIYLNFLYPIFEKFETVDDFSTIQTMVERTSESLNTSSIFTNNEGKENATFKRSEKV